jgi:hypothetical protein
VVCEAVEHRGGPYAETAGAAQPLGRRNGLTPAAIRREEVEELGRLGDHRANSLRSMNLVGSKDIERRPRLSNTLPENAVSSQY